jgi:RHS repeat-associated protein
MLYPKQSFAGSNSCTTSSTPSKTAGKVGGVALDQAATFLAEMDDIRGAYYDETKDRIVFVGKTNTSLPEFDKDDLAVAIKALLFNKAIPAVSIEDSTISGKMEVIYYGGIDNTRFGKVLFDADMKLKQYTMGYDEDDNPISSSVSGYKSLIKRYLDKNPAGSLINEGRQWIEPDEVVLKKDDASDSFVFDTVTMKVDYEARSEENDPLYDEAGEEFVANLTANYDAYADEIPEYKDTKQLAKIVSVIKWLSDNGIASDFSWAYDYSPLKVATPTIIDALSVTIPSYNGYTNIGIFGGVQYTTANDYETDTGDAADLKTASENVHAPKEDINWTFTESGQTYQAVAVAADAFRSIGSYSTSATDMTFPTSGDLNLAFTRNYSSFSGGQFGIGRGWKFLPSLLVDNHPLANGILLSVCDVGGDTLLKRKALAFDVDGQRETFTYEDTSQCSYLPDENSYHSKIVVERDGGHRTLYHVTTKDQTTYTFVDMVNVPIVTNYEMRLISVADKNNSKINYNYVSSSSAQLTNIGDDQGHAISFTYGSNGLISKIKDWTNREVNYSYDSQGNLTKVTDPEGEETDYDYDENNKLILLTDREENDAIENTYNSQSKLETQTTAGGVVSNYAYDDVNRIATKSSTLSRISTTKYDSKARILEELDPLNGKTTYTYGTEYSPLTIRDRNNNLTTNTYDGNGNLTSVTFPDANQVSYQYNSKNQITKITDGRYGVSPKITQYTYDGNGNMTQASESGHLTNFTYNGDGEMLTTTNPLSKTTTWTRDSFGNALTETNPLSKVLTFEYDSLGRLKKQTDPLGRFKTYTYDLNSNILTSTTSAGITAYEYSKENKLKKTTLPNGIFTQFGYNASGSIASVSAPLSANTSYIYDQYQNLTSRIDALNRTTSYEYDKLNRRIETSTPLGKETDLEYDANGNITKRTDPNGNETDYDYDELNRLVKITYDDNSEVDYVYDDRGNLISMEDSIGTTSYEYDVFNRLTEVTDVYGFTTEYTYNNADQLTQITYPGNKTVAYTYDNAGRLIETTDWNNEDTAYTYYDNGLVHTRTLPNEIITTYSYDNTNRLTDISHEKDSEELADFSYVRNNIGNIIYSTESGSLIAGSTSTASAAPIALDGGQSTHNSGGNITLSSFAVTGANDNRFLLVAVGSHQGGGSTGATGVTYGGVGMTKLAEQIGSYGEFVQLWGLQAPAGGTGNIVTSGLSGGDYTFLAAYSLYNVKQTYTVVSDNLSQSSNYSSVSITPNSADNWIIDAIQSEPVPTVDGDNIEDWSENGHPNSYDNGSGSTIIQSGGPAEVDMNWALSYGARSNHAAVALEPAEASSEGSGGGGGSTIELDGTIESTYNTGGNITLSSFPVNGSNSNRFLLVSVGSHQGGGATGATGVTYGGVAMTKLAQQIGQYGEFVQMWGLQAPAGGSGNIVTAGISGGDYTFLAAYSLYNVKQTYTVVSDNLSQSSNYSSVTVTPNSANNVIVDVIEAEPVPTVDGDNELDWSENGHPNSYDNGSGSSILQSGGPIAVDMDWSLSYGARSNHVAVALEPAEASGGASSNFQFTYDPLGRLTAATSTNNSFAYTYDKVGNMLTGTIGASSSAFTYNNDNRLTVKDGTSYSYDNNGNITGFGSKTLTFNFENKLATYAASGSPTHHFLYDGNGKRVAEKENSSLTKKYINDVSGDLEKVLIAKDLTNSTDNYYIYGNGLISEGGVSSGNREYYLEDGIGNIRIVTDSNGEYIKDLSYDPYGNLSSGIGEEDFQYKGEQFDPNTNLSYMRARYYDPGIGRFISRDPIEGDLMNPQTQNGYNFASGDSINYADPSGEDYVNVGVSVGIVPLAIGVGALVDLDKTGVYLYHAAGVAFPGGIGASVTYSKAEPSPGTDASFQTNFMAGPIPIAYQLNVNPKTGTMTTEAGLGARGASAMIQKTYGNLCK